MKPIVHLANAAANHAPVSPNPNPPSTQTTTKKPPATTTPKNARHAASRPCPPRRPIPPSLRPIRLDPGAILPLPASPRDDRAWFAALPPPTACVLKVGPQWHEGLHEARRERGSGVCCFLCFCALGGYGDWVRCNEGPGVILFRFLHFFFVVRHRSSSTAHGTACRLERLECAGVAFSETEGW